MNNQGAQNGHGDYLSVLAFRTLREDRVLQPRRPSIFDAEPWGEIAAEVPQPPSGLPPGAALAQTGMLAAPHPAPAASPAGGARGTGDAAGTIHPAPGTDRFPAPQTASEPAPPGRAFASGPLLTPSIPHAAARVEAALNTPPSESPERAQRSAAPGEFAPGVESRVPDPVPARPALSPAPLAMPRVPEPQRSRESAADAPPGNPSRAAPPNQMASIASPGERGEAPPEPPVRRIEGEHAIQQPPAMVARSVDAVRAPHPRWRFPQKSAPEPVVEISIGRLEIRAATPAPARVSRAAPARPQETLSDYLKRTSGGRT
jgi:hypothetical protein